MKRKLLILSLICSMGMFTSCVDKTKDDWKKIPTTEIAGDNAMLTVNGMKQQGSIKLQVSNATTGVLTLNNLLLGYQNMNVDVALTAKGDGSFDFAGEKAFNFAEVKSASDYATMMTIKLNGNINLEGKAAVTITTSADGGLVGTWSFSTTIVNNEEPSIHTKSAPVLFYWPAKTYSKYTSDGYYLGFSLSTIASHFISEVLNEVTFNKDGSITAKYYPEIKMGGAESLPEWIMVRLFGDGPIAPEARTWIDAPKGFASWYAKGDLIYIMPNIESIIKIVAGDDVDVKEMMVIIETLKVADDATLKGIMGMVSEMAGMDLSIIPVAQVREILNWMTTGIPLRYGTKDNKLFIHVDKKMVTPYMPIVFHLMSTLQAQVDATPEGEENILAIIPSMLGVEKFTELETIWKTNTSDIFEIGLMLKK